MITHPSLPRLAAFAGGELDDAGRARVARHLERCADCRRASVELGEARDALRRATAPPPPAGAWNAIAARVSAGEQVILPAPEPAAQRPPPRWLRAAAVAALLLAGGAAALFSTREAVAENSVLQLSPDRPGTGATVRVAYRPGTLLAGADRLVLRARLLDDDGEPAGEMVPVQVAQLRREGRVYRASFALPDSIVYAVFAVEDEGGTRVDHNGERWELVVRDSAGRPLPRALWRRSEDLDQRDTQASLQTALRMTELSPGRPDGWIKRFYAEVELASQARRDSVTRMHRERARALSAALAGRGGLTAGEVGTMVLYADAVDDTTLAAEWRQRLYDRWPRDPGAYQQRVFALTELHRGDTPALFAAMEEMWAEGGTASAQLALVALQVAMQTRDAQAVLRWGDRLAALKPAYSTMVARAAIRMPAVRPEGMERVRRALHWLENAYPAHRPLAVNAGDHRAETDRARGFFLGALGHALVESGRQRAGMDTLQIALGITWDPALFRGIADARLAQGDTAGAMAVLARVAADPGTAAGYADSARARLGGVYRADAWAREVQAARGRMREYAMRRAENRAVRGDLLLADAAGARTRIEPANGAPTLVAFWSRFCPPSRAELRELETVSRALRSRGVRVVTVSADAPGADFRAFVARNGLTFPIYFDPDRAARRALQNHGTPAYLVLDSAGRIRFDTIDLEDVLRQAEVLRATP
jgi:peroxiredoxin